MAETGQRNYGSKAVPMMIIGIVAMLITGSFYRFYLGPTVREGRMRRNEEFANYVYQQELAALESKKRERFE